MTRKKDVLSVKQSNLDAYRMQHDYAISAVSRTISQLSLLSDGIAEEISDIDAYQAGLNETREGLMEAKEKNDRVVDRLKALFEIE